jgi:F0F1-type ATP synthase membrane subunit c/vacuolar-type H+-ATPase subunit K
MERTVPIILVPAGLACIVAALIHGYLGQKRLIAPAKFPNRQAKALVGVIWQFSTAIWAVCGAIIGASPWLFDDHTRQAAVLGTCLPLAWGIIGNAWITRGQHFGWKMLATIVSAAILGVMLPH